MNATEGAFERTTLENGTRVLTAPMPHVQSTSCFVMLAAGSRYESRESSGIAHFSEHMFFKGTERRPRSRDITSEIDAIGGEFNAFTSKEYTGYYVRCGAETRDTALDVLTDMLRNSKFEEDEIEREKGVIVEEMNMHFDTPRDSISGYYDELLYGDQPLGWDIIGTKESVRGVTRDTFLDYLGRWYKPERMVIGVGGRIEGDLIDKLEELLGDMPAGETGLPAPVELPADNGPRVALRTKQSDQAHLRLGVRSYPLVHPDRYALQLLVTILGGGMSSRLWTEVRERRGLAYYVYGANNAYTDVGSLYAQAGVDISRIDEAIETIVGELRKIAEEPVPSDELEKARSSSKGRFVLQLESPHGTILFGLRREVLEGRGARGDRGAGRAGRRHRRGHPARGAGHRRPRRPAPGADRAVRRRGALREAAGGLADRAGLDACRLPARPPPEHPRLVRRSQPELEAVAVAGRVLRRRVQTGGGHADAVDARLDVDLAAAGLPAVHAAEDEPARRRVERRLGHVIPVIEVRGRLLVPELEVDPHDLVGDGSKGHEPRQRVEVSLERGPVPEQRPRAGPRPEVRVAAGVVAVGDVELVVARVQLEAKAARLHHASVRRGGRLGKGTSAAVTRSAGQSAPLPAPPVTALSTRDRRGVRSGSIPRAADSYAPRRRPAACRKRSPSTTDACGWMAGRYVSRTTMRGPPGA